MGTNGAPRRRAAVTGSAVVVAAALLLPGCSRGGGPALPIPVPLRHHQRGSLEPCAPALAPARAAAAQAGRRSTLRAVRRATYRGAVRLVRDAGGELSGQPSARPTPRASARPTGRHPATGQRGPTPRPSGDTAGARAGTPSPEARVTGVDEVCVFAFHGDYGATRELAVVVTARHPRVLAAVPTRRPVSR